MKNVEPLKNTLRSAHTSQKRPESVAEHTWSICLLMMCFEDQLDDFDMLRLFKLIIIHDLADGTSGNIDFPFNLTYGTSRTDAHPLLKQIREIVDEGTRARIL